MDLRFLFIFVLVAFIGVQADDDDDECSEQELTGCLSGLLALIAQGESDEGVICSTMRQTYSCLKSKAELCLSGDDMETAQSKLDEMKQLIISHCGSVEEEDDEEEDEERGEEEEEDDPHAQCFQAEQEYLMECVEESTEKAIEVFVKSGERNLDKIKCGSYSIIADCFVTKAEEKCGEEAAKALYDEMADLPPEIKESCEAAGIQDLFDLDLLDDDEKK